MHAKRIFLIWNGKKEEVLQVMRELEKDSYQVVYVVTNEKKEFPLPGVVVHIDDDARIGIPASGVPHESFPPAGKSLLERLYKTESLVLTMMNRKVDSPDRPLVLDQKKHLYYEVVRYWHGVLSFYKPDLIIFPAVPHNISNFVMYSLARLLKIPTILFQETWASDRILLQSEYEKESVLLQEALLRNKNKKTTTEDLAPDLRKYYETHASARDTTPFDVKVLAKQYSLANRLKLKFQAALKSIRDLTFFKKIFKYVKRTFGENLKKEYNRYLLPVEYTKPFVYVPLHWQPECTTSPLGEMFVDQILMVETLSAVLPSDWVLYVKEHPFQWSVDGVTQFTPMRYQGYYQKLARLKNVRLIGVESDTYSLIAHAKAVATITGRAGIEGVFRGIPALIFGLPWYRSLPGIFMVEDVLSVKAALTLIKNGFKVNQQEVLNYLKSFDESTVRGYMEPLGSLNSTISREKSIQNILDLFKKGTQHLPNVSAKI